MVTISQTVAATLVAYLIGGIPFGLLIGKLNGIDIRRHGSGNIGATNVLRVVGKDWGVACFALDFLKGLLPVLLLPRLLPQANSALPVLVAGATVLGHMFSPYLRFKGGKGVATSIGVLLALCFWPALVGMLAWLAVFVCCRYVSLASIVAAAVVPLAALLDPRVDNWTRLLLLILAALVILRHRSNIKKLLAGSESRFDRRP